jgi:hypothetical protein
MGKIDLIYKCMGEYASQTFLGLLHDYIIPENEQSTTNLAF